MRHVGKTLNPNFVFIRVGAQNKMLSRQLCLCAGFFVSVGFSDFHFDCMTFCLIEWLKILTIFFRSIRNLGMGFKVSSKVAS